MVEKYAELLQAKREFECTILAVENWLKHTEQPFYKSFKDEQTHTLKEALEGLKKSKEDLRKFHMEQYLKEDGKPL